MVKLLRSLSAKLDLPLTILQDLQGPKIRVGELPEEVLLLREGASFTLVPVAEYKAEEVTTIL